jgi:hypothetical protein
MAFPSTVRADIAVGFVGDLAFEGPLKAQPGILNSADAAYNVVGRAFTHTGTDGVFAAGGEGTFAGILANRAEYTTAGTAAGGALAPTMTLRNGEVGGFVQETSGLFVNLIDGFGVGYYVIYNITTGELDSVAQNGTIARSWALVPGASVVRYGSGTAGLAIISISGELAPFVAGGS